MANTRRDRVVVLSDIHFGDPGSTLGVPGEAERPAAESRATALMAAINSRGGASEVVLLGDIFETWTASFEDSVAAARPFLYALEALDPDRIVFVPGNHDYHLLVQHREDALRRALREGIPPPWPVPIQQTYDDSHLAGLLPESLRDRLIVTYPNYSRSIGSARVVFHHGHHLATIRGGDMFALGPRFVLERLERLRAQDLTLQALERGSHVFFEMTHSLGLSSGARERIVSFWGRLLATRHVALGVRSVLSASLGRGGLASNRATRFYDVSHFRQPARRYLALWSDATDTDWYPEILIFGHTHRQGVAGAGSGPAARPTGRAKSVLQSAIGRRPPAVGEAHDLHLVNTGCWFREAEKRNQGHFDILGMLDEDELLLCRFVDPELELVARLPLASSHRALVPDPS